MTTRSNPRILYGIHSVTPYNRTSGLYYGMLEVLKGSTLTLSGDLVELRGGSYRYPYAVEDGNINAELAINCSEYPNFLFELFLGKAPTVVAAEATGNVSTLTNKFGTSIVSATTGIATATLKSGQAAQLKFGKYVVKCTGAAKVKVYCSTNIDFARGTDVSFTTDDLECVAELTITTGAAVEITNTGVELTGGSGTIGMTTSDVATFEVRPLTTGSNMTATIGATSDVFSSFGALLYSAQRGSGEMFEIDAFNVKAIGCALGAQEKAYSEWSVTGKLAYDSARGGLFSLRHIVP